MELPLVRARFVGTHNFAHGVYPSIKDPGCDFSLREIPFLDELQLGRRRVPRDSLPDGFVRLFLMVPIGILRHDGLGITDIRDTSIVGNP